MESKPASFQKTSESKRPTFVAGLLGDSRFSAGLLGRGVPSGQAKGLLVYSGFKMSPISRAVTKCEVLHVAGCIFLFLTSGWFIIKKLHHFDAKSLKSIT